MVCVDQLMRDRWNIRQDSQLTNWIDLLIDLNRLVWDRSPTNSMKTITACNKVTDYPMFNPIFFVAYPRPICIKIMRLYIRIVVVSKYIW